MYKPSYRHTCINASVSVHTQSAIRVTDLVYEKKNVTCLSQRYYLCLSYLHVLQARRRVSIFGGAGVEMIITFMCTHNYGNTPK